MMDDTSARIGDDLSDAGVSLSGKLMGLDVGLARIGVAVCDPLQLRARPLTIIERTTRRNDFELLAKLLLSEEAQAVVCGMPINMDGSEGDQARTTRKWATRLAHALRAILGKPVPVVFWDERLSTYAAREYLVEANQFEADDAIAAAIILQRYLDRDASGVVELGVIVLPPKTAESSPTDRDGR